MPLPMEYRLASQDFDHFLGDVMNETGLNSRHQAYTTTQAVFLCFRRRLSLADAIAFAQGLPAMLRALFVADWDTTQAQSQLWDRETMVEEVKQLRSEHNFSPDDAIEAVARVVHRHVDPRTFALSLGRLPDAAKSFWR